jgi:hypothetical protein
MRKGDQVAREDCGDQPDGSYYEFCEDVGF